MRTGTIITAILFAVTLLFSGCSKSVSLEDVCAKIAEADEVADCTEEIGRELAQCTNADVILACMGELDSENEMEACFAACERASE